MGTVRRCRRRRSHFIDVLMGLDWHSLARPVVDACRTREACRDPRRSECVHHLGHVLSDPSARSEIGAFGDPRILAQGMIKGHAHPRACTLTSRLHGSGARFLIVTIVLVAIVLELFTEVKSKSTH